MTPQQFEILSALSKSPEEYLSPKEFGGAANSYHSRIARQLCKLGYVRSVTFTLGGGQKHYRKYRITPKGLGAIHHGN